MPYSTRDTDLAAAIAVTLHTGPPDIRTGELSHLCTFTFPTVDASDAERVATEFYEGRLVLSVAAYARALRELKRLLRGVKGVAR